MDLQRRSELVNELAVIVLSVVVVLGLERLFTNQSYRVDLLVLVCSSHLLAVVTRRAGVGIAVSALISTAGLLIVGNISLFPETSDSVFPTRETLELLRADIGVAWAAFEDQRAPVDPLRGFVVAAGVTLWWVAAFADWAALRLRSSLETIVPATIVFVFTALLGTGDRAVLHASLFVAAVGAVMVAMRATRQARENVWIASGASAGLTATMRVGAAGTMLALVIGASVGPRFPNAGEQLLDPAEWDNGPQTRFVTSPLVDISANLVEQSQLEMFSVGVDDPDLDRHYWRQMALTEFAGSEWRRSSKFDDARGAVGSDVDDSVARRTVRQEVTTRRLGGIYLPVAYEASNIISSQGIGLEYERETGALVIERNSESDAAAGFTYVVESAVPEYDPAALPADATAGLDQAFIDELTALPPVCDEGQTSADGCWNPLLTELAETQTASASTDYERALALQEFFLDPRNFSYNLNVSQDHDLESMEDFLYFVREGYCEQFASTFAALARAIGIPARVAVGFTWGDWDETRQAFIVRGTHAHAWPEVYFAGLGWIVFDPTPGRAPAHNTSLSGLAQPQQFGFNDDAAQGSNTITPTTLPSGTGEGSFGSDFNLPDEIPETTAPETPTAVGPGSGDTDGGGVLPVVSRALLMIGIVATALATIPALRWGLRRRRVAQVADDPTARAEMAWREAAEALRLIGVVAEPSETLHEFARRSDALAVPVGPVTELADAITIVRYADLHDVSSHALAAQRASTQVAEVCRNQITRSRKIADALDPRTLSRR